MSIDNLARGAAVFVLPLRNRFRNTDIRFGALFEGPSGWAEFAPFPEYSDDVAGRWLAGALEQAFGEWPTQIRSQVPVNAIVPIADLGTTRKLVDEAIRHGMTTIKVKVGGNESSATNDAGRIAVIREVLNANGIAGAIRIDANAAWTPAQAVERLQMLNEVAHGLDYVEQPCETFDDLRALKQAMSSWEQPVRIAVDEGVRQATSVDVAAIQEVADIVIIKSLPLGGVHRSLQIIDQIGLPVIVSGSLDTSVGLTSGIQLAASVPDLAGACGLGTGSLFAQDVVARPLVPTDGSLPVGRVVPDSDLLKAVQPSADIVADWQARIVQAWNASAKDLVSDEVREAVMA